LKGHTQFIVGYAIALAVGILGLVLWSSADPHTMSFGFPAVWVCVSVLKWLLRLHSRFCQATKAARIHREVNDGRA
jgi:hypothetical protein